MCKIRKSKMNFKYSNKISGFTLVELMISIIAMSVIIAVFTPTISRHMKTMNNNVGEAEMTYNCTQFKDENNEEHCILCKTNGAKVCLICDKTCPVGKTLNKDVCKCI